MGAVSVEQPEQTIHRVAPGEPGVSDPGEQIIFGCLNPWPRRHRIPRRHCTQPPWARRTLWT